MPPPSGVAYVVAGLFLCLMRWPGLLNESGACRKLLLTQHSGDDITQVRAELFHGLRPLAGIDCVDRPVLPELLQNLRYLLQAPIEL